MNKDSSFSSKFTPEAGVTYFFPLLPSTIEIRFVDDSLFYEKSWAELES